MIDEPNRYRIVNAETHRVHSEYKNLHAAEQDCQKLNTDFRGPFLRYHVEEIPQDEDDNVVWGHA